MAEPALHGRFVWYELMTPDPAAAIPFYREIMGWETEAVDGDVPYTMWTSGRGPVGGLMELPDEARRMGAPPHWMGYVQVDDVDGSARTAVSLGGKVWKDPADVPGMGRFAVLADPQGAVFALWRSSHPSPAPEGPALSGEFSWHELATTDSAAAWTFYSSLLGWRHTESTDMGELGSYQMFGWEPKSAGGIFSKPAEMAGPPFWLYYTRVGDVDAAAAKVLRLGGQVLNGPLEVPGGDRIVQCIDPQGAAFALHSVAGDR